MNGKDRETKANLYLKLELIVRTCRVNCAGGRFPRYENDLYTRLFRESSILGQFRVVVADNVVKNFRQDLR